MATTTLNATSSAFPSITNRTRAELYKVSDPTAIYASIIDTTSGHPQRDWQFVGLDRTNYLFQITEIDGSGNILSVLSVPMAVTPDNLDGTLVRPTEQIQVGVTTGLVAGNTSATFDGTGGAPDYRGWTIRPAIIGGSNFMILGVEYSYDSVTGIFSLLQAGDEFAAGQYYNIQFDTRINPAGGSAPTTFDLTPKLITTNTTLDANDIGKQIIVEPSGTYLEITFPAGSTVVSGRETHIEVSPSATMCCVKLVFGSDTVNFLRGNLYLLPNESLTVYLFKRSVGVYEWRIKNAVGNFINVGQLCYSDAANVDAVNMQELVGLSVDSTQYARFYNEFILNLPITQVCDYDDWNTTPNQSKFSLANSANPAYYGKFMFPDRRDVFLRATSSIRTPGDLQTDAIKAHAHEERVFQAVGNAGLKPIGFANTTGTLTGAGYTTSDFGDTETRPVNSSSRLYVML